MSRYSTREHKRRYGRFSRGTWISSWSGKECPRCFTPKYTHGTPGKGMKKQWNSDVREQHKREIQAAARNDWETLSLSPESRVKNLWDWY